MDEGDGLLHWPMLLFYPEAGMQHDVVEDVCEEDVLRCGERGAGSGGGGGGRCTGSG